MQIAHERLTGVFEFPSDDAVPLVQFQRQVPVAFDPFGVVYAYRSQKLEMSSENNTCKDTWQFLTSDEWRWVLPGRSYHCSEVSRCTARSCFKHTLE